MGHPARLKQGQAGHGSGSRRKALLWLGAAAAVLLYLLTARSAPSVGPSSIGPPAPATQPPSAGRGSPAGRFSAVRGPSSVDKPAPACGAPSAGKHAAHGSAAPGQVAQDTAAPGEAAAGDPARGDPSAWLYSRKPVLAEDGAPWFTVRILEGQQAARVLSPRGSILLIAGPTDRTGLRLGAEVTVRVSDSRPARLSYDIEIDEPRRSASHRGWLTAQVQRWRQRGYAAFIRERGGPLTLPERTLDLRRTSIVLGQTTDANAAAVLADDVWRRFRAIALVREQLVERPRGSIVVEEMDGERRRLLRAGAVGLVSESGAPLQIIEGAARPWQERRSYLGQVYATVDRGGTLALVNFLPAERLLFGLLPAETFASAPAEALRAQAICARGQLFAKLWLRHLADPYLSCPTQHCQVYAGAGREDARTTAAVTATTGQVLMRRGGALVDTVYSASCGGVAEAAGVVWGDGHDPNLKPRFDAHAGRLPGFQLPLGEQDIRRLLRTNPPTYCSTSRFNLDGRTRWTLRRTGPEMEHLLATLPRPHQGALVDISVHERSASGRALEVLLRFEHGNSLVHGPSAIRSIFGNLRSALFSVDTLPGGTAGASGPTFVFRGAGFGHGVGFCQTGAIGMAEAGHRHQEILWHYYPGSLLMRLY